MATRYPGQIDNNLTLPNSIDNVTAVKSEVVNRLKDAIIALQTELGVKPSTTYGTVRSRLDSIENGLNSLTFLTGDLGGTKESVRVIGIMGNPISETPPNLGQVLRWNGLAWEPSDASGGGSTVTFAGDLSGNSSSQTVIKIQNIAISSTAPTDNQVMVYDAGTTNWKPTSLGGYIDCVAVSGKFTVLGVGSNVFTNAGNVQVNAGDFTIESCTFECVLEATPGETAEVRLYNLTDGGVVSGSLLSTSANTPTYQSASITISGDKLYEVQIRITSGSPGSDDGASCTNAKIRIKY